MLFLTGWEWVVSFFFQGLDQFASSGGLCDEEFPEILFSGGMCDELVEPETEYCGSSLESLLEPPTKLMCCVTATVTPMWPTADLAINRILVSIGCTILNYLIRVHMLLVLVLVVLMESVVLGYGYQYVVDFVSEVTCVVKASGLMGVLFRLWPATCNFYFHSFLI